MIRRLFKVNKGFDTLTLVSYGDPGKQKQVKRVCGVVCYTHLLHTLHTTFTHFTHNLYTLYTQPLHTLHTNLTHGTHHTTPHHTLLNYLFIYLFIRGKGRGCVSDEV